MRGTRFGDFEWQASSSQDVIAEIAECSYDDEARLFLLPPWDTKRPRVSTGQLWTTKIAFSEVRTFVH